MLPLHAPLARACARPASARSAAAARSTAVAASPSRSTPLVGSQPAAWVRSCLSTHGAPARAPGGQRASRPPRAASGEGPPPDELPTSSAFAQSDIVQAEAAAIFSDFSMLSSMQPKYFSFDVEGKRIYISKMEDFLERLKIFTFRYEMSDDPFAKECMRRLNAQLLEAGLTLRGMTTQFDSLLDFMRRDIEAEARRGVAPATGDSRAAVQGGAWGSGGMPDIAKLMADPDIREAMADPSVVAVLQKCMADPSQIMQYRSNPKVNKLLMALFKQGGGAGG